MSGLSAQRQRLGAHVRRRHPTAFALQRAARFGFKVKYPDPVRDHWSTHARVGLLAQWTSSRRGARAEAQRLAGVSTWVTFIGNQRSGHSLLASLIDAHPAVAISHELHALSYVAAGFGRDQVAWMALDNAAQYGRRGRGESGYDYEVPGQWQGRCEHLRVVGDKDARRDTKLLLRDPTQRARLLSTMSPWKVRFVHAVRNPFDNISSVCKDLPGPGPDPGKIDLYFDLAQAAHEVRAQMPAADVHLVRHEDLVDDPRQVLTDVASFLEVDVDPSWLEACVAIVRPSPHRIRHRLEWSTEERVSTQARIDQYDFLAGYSWAD